MVAQLCDSVACNGFYDPFWTQVSIQGGGNTLIIPVVSKCPPTSPIEALIQCGNDFHAKFPEAIACWFQLCDCGATIYGCDLSQELFILGVGSFPGLPVSTSVGSCGAVLYDANPAITKLLNPRTDAELIALHAALCPPQPLILGPTGGTGPGGGPAGCNPNPSCAVNCCPPDPPMPRFVPVNFGRFLKIGDQPLPEVPAPPTPLMLPIPTRSIAVTACNSCEEEVPIDEL